MTLGRSLGILLVTTMSFVDMSRENKYVIPVAGSEPLSWGWQVVLISRWLSQG